MNIEEFIKQHKYINYCEAVISPTGDIEYAIPGHTYKLIDIAKEPKEQLEKMMPIQAAPMYWLIEHTGYASIWYNFAILPWNYTKEQMDALQKLCDNNILQNSISCHTSAEKTNCQQLENFKGTPNLIERKSFTITRKEK